MIKFLLKHSRCKTTEYVGVCVGWGVVWCVWLCVCGVGVWVGVGVCVGGGVGGVWGCGGVGCVRMSVPGAGRL